MQLLFPLSTHKNTVQSQSNNAPREQQEMTDRNCNFFLAMWSGEEKHKYFVCFLQTNYSSDGHLFQALHCQYNLPYMIIKPAKIKEIPEGQIEAVCVKLILKYLIDFN